MKVWILHGGEYEERRIVGVYASLALAKAAASIPASEWKPSPTPDGVADYYPSASGYYDIEVWDVDDEPRVAPSDPGASGIAVGYLQMQGLTKPFRASDPTSGQVETITLQFIVPDNEAPGVLSIGARYERDGRRLREWGQSVWLSGMDRDEATIKARAIVDDIVSSFMLIVAPGMVYRWDETELNRIVQNIMARVVGLVGEAGS